MELGTIQLQAIADDTALTAATEYQNGNGSWETVAAAEATSVATAGGLSSVSRLIPIWREYGFLHC